MDTCQITSETSKDRPYIYSEPHHVVSFVAHFTVMLIRQYAPPEDDDIMYEEGENLSEIDKVLKVSN